MSLDLYERETADLMSRMRPVQVPETGAFDGFIRGTGLATMKGFAKTSRAVDLLGSVGPIVQDTFTGGIEAQDRYFKEHDETFGAAVDYWTAKPGEVGAAAEVVGGLASMLPVVIASPALAVGATPLGTAEDLALKGVSSVKAQAVGTAQAAGLGLGIWMPILGQNLWQRIVLGGAGFNVLQGAAMRGAGEMILKGTPAEGEFQAFDPASLTLDVLLGAAFGSLAHLSPAQRAQGKAAWERIQKWASDLPPSDVDAIAALRQSQHLNVDSAPGIPVAPADVEAHVNRLRTAIDQLAQDKPVSVEDMPAAKVEADSARWTEAEARGKELIEIAERVRVEEGLPVIEVYHGSPYEFTEFDYSKIGTGEGAQAYGHGLYFAESRGVAQSYASKLAVIKGGSVDGEPFDSKEPMHMAAYLAKEFGDRKAAIDHVDYFTEGGGIPKGEEAAAAVYAAETKAILRSDAKLPNYETGERLYKVQIPQRVVDSMLDWDRPLSEQPGNVKAAVEKLTYLKPRDGEVTMGDVMKRVREQGDPEADMRSAGIPGIRYLDQVSRATGEGTSNFVLFDPKFAKITHKNGDPVQQKSAMPPAKDKALDPVAVEAQRFVSEQPDVQISVGRNADGTPITKSAKQFLDDTRKATTLAAEDAKLFDVAAACLLGVA